MSRTYRNYETWVDWLDGFEDKLRRGHVAVPLGVRGGEVWGKAKRYVKARRNRATRRAGKEEATV